MSDPKFKTIYWGKGSATEAKFKLTDSLPPTDLITTCFVIPTYQDKLVITKFICGWGFPGGHREQGETAEECLRRETLEESSAVLGELKLVGRWKATKILEIEWNKDYPKIAYQMLYVSEVTKLEEFVKTEDAFERILIKPNQLSKYHFNYEDYGDVFRYVLDLPADKKWIPGSSPRITRGRKEE